MLKALKQLFEAGADDAHAVPALERRQLQLAVAVLVHEARRADYAEASKEETRRAQAALAKMFKLDEASSAKLLAEGHAKAQTLSSFYAPVSVVKREYSMEERITLVEHLWHIAFADGELNPYEDHYVRKIAHLLYVPNTQSMVARNRARGS
jgi:uncharacterized tellurite resistance protein B-like protein